MKVNYNEKALANCAFSMIPTFVVVTPPLSTSKGKTFEANEKTKWLGLDNELTAQLFDDVEDDGDKHSTAELIGLTDGDDDLCDDESVSFSYDDFVTKGLWIAGQENACKTSPNHTNKWICASRHPSFGTRGIQTLLLLRTYRIELLQGCLVIRKFTNVVLAVMICRFWYSTRGSFLSCMIWMRHGCCLFASVLQIQMVLSSTRALLYQLTRVQDRSTTLMVFTWTLKITNLAMQ